MPSKQGKSFNTIEHNVYEKQGPFSTFFEEDSISRLACNNVKRRFIHISECVFF
jgi:hypothetical protein